MFTMKAWKHLNKNKNDIAKDVKKQLSKDFGRKCSFAFVRFFALPVMSIDLFIKPQSVSRQDTMFIIEAWKQLNRISNKNQKLHSERCKKVTVERFLEEMLICICAIYVSPVVSIDLFIELHPRQNATFIIEAWKWLIITKNSISKGFFGKMFVSICAIFASPIVCVGSFIESLVELIRAACNFYNANAEAIKKRSQQSAFTEVPRR